MPWDFETEPEFQRELDWMTGFVRNEIEPLDLVPEQDRDRKARTPVKKVDGMRARFDLRDLVPAATQLIDVRDQVAASFPRHVILGAERRLAELTMWWSPSES